MIVKICRLQSSVMQSAPTSKMWAIRFESNRPPATDPLTGCTYGVAPRKQLTLRFTSKSSAISYAKRNGLSYEVENTETPDSVVKSYQDNFSRTRAGSWTH